MVINNISGYRTGEVCADCSKQEFFCCENKILLTMLVHMASKKKKVSIFKEVIK